MESLKGDSTQHHCIAEFPRSKSTLHSYYILYFSFGVIKTTAAVAAATTTKEEEYLRGIKIYIKKINNIQEFLIRK